MAITKGITVYVMRAIGKTKTFLTVVGRKFYSNPYNHDHGVTKVETPFRYGITVTVLNFTLSNCTVLIDLVSLKDYKGSILR